MVRTQIQLTEEQADAIKRLAAARGTSMAALIRDAVDRLTQESDHRDPRERALAAIGAFAGAGGNAAEEHDRHLDEIYAE